LAKSQPCFDFECADRTFIKLIELGNDLESKRKGKKRTKEKPQTDMPGDPFVSPRVATDDNYQMLFL
jgi:hypothetical protein